MEESHWEPGDYLDFDSPRVKAFLAELPDQVYIYGGYLMPGPLVSQERLKSIQDLDFRLDDVIIVSYPKSERGDSKQEMENGESEVLGPRICITHLPLQFLPKQILKIGCKIIYISRNPKDNAVSFFNFHKISRYIGCSKITWDKFLPLYTAGKIYYGSWFDHIMEYWELKQQNQQMLFLKYEDLKKNLPSEIARISEFLEIDLPSYTLTKIVQNCSFDMMKNNEMVNGNDEHNCDQSVINFMRKGVVGDWKNYFTVSQNEQFNEIYDRKMKNVSLKFEFELAT